MLLDRVSADFTHRMLNRLFLACHLHVRHVQLNRLNGTAVIKSHVNCLTLVKMIGVLTVLAETTFSKSRARHARQLRSFENIYCVIEGSGSTSTKAFEFLSLKWTSLACRPRILRVHPNASPDAVLRVKSRIQQRKTRDVLPSPVRTMNVRGTDRRQTQSGLAIIPICLLRRHLATLTLAINDASL